MTVVLSPATFDYVCAPLRCPRCRHTAVDPCSIDLQTKIAGVPGCRELSVGAFVDCRADLGDGIYLKMHDAPPVETVRVVDCWSCPVCRAPFLWAMLTLERGVLIRVEPVLLDEATLEIADYVTRETLHMAPLKPDDSIMRLLRLAPADLRRELAQLEVRRTS